MKLIAIVAIAAAIALSGCGGTSHAEQVKMCEQYLNARYSQYIKNNGGRPITHRPAQCDGVTNAELNRIVGRIIARHLGG